MSLEKSSRESFYSKRQKAKRKHEQEARSRMEQRRQQYNQLPAKEKQHDPS